MIVPLDRYAVLPRLAGVWNGEFICLDDDGRETKRYRCRITQEIVQNRWIQRNENSYADGCADVWRFFGMAIAPGRMALESPDAPYDGFVMRVDEAGPDVVLLNVWDQASGVRIATETFTLITANIRVRTIQQFSAPGGQLRGFMTVKEQRER